MSIAYHDEHPADRAAMQELRAVIALHPPGEFGPAVRPDFDTLIARTPMAAGVACEPGEVAGVPGWWCRPADEVPGAVILYLHGGAYVAGTAAAYRGLAGQVALRAGMALFVPDYSLAPERPFPAAVEDAVKVYNALAAIRAVALVGDSAGGGLALALLSVACSGGPRPACAGVMSPWTDLALTGGSMLDRARHDPLLNREALAAAARFYVHAEDRRNPRASPLYAEAAGLPPVMIHVGEDEVLLDDALRYAERVEAAGGSAEAHVWRGATHVFPSSFPNLRAAGQALDTLGSFVRRHLGGEVGHSGRRERAHEDRPLPGRSEEKLRCRGRSLP